MFVNYSIQSFADIICMYYVGVINRYAKSVKDILRFLLLMVILFTIVELANEHYFMESAHHLWTVPLLVFLIRLNIVSIQNYQYQANQLLFPVEMRGEAFGLVNFLSRPFAAFSTIIVEYTSSPLSFVLVLGLLSTQAVHRMKEINEQNKSNDDLFV